MTKGKAENNNRSKGIRTAEPNEQYLADMDEYKEGEDRKKREIAKAMKAGGESIEKISLYTGLSAEEIAAL